MGFKFRYEALLSYRQHIKEKAEIELSHAQRQLNQCRELLKNYRESLWLTNQDLGSNLKAKMPSHILKNHSDYITALKINIEAQKIEIERAEKFVAEKLENLLAKTKQYKVIERLKERDFLKWNHQQNLMEQKEISEMAVLRYGKEFL